MPLSESFTMTNFRVRVLSLERLSSVISTRVPDLSPSAVAMAEAEGALGADVFAGDDTLVTPGGEPAARGASPEVGFSSCLPPPASESPSNVASTPLTKYFEFGLNILISL